MKPSVHSAKQNFKNSYRNKNGSIFIEASIIFPLACIIAIAMLHFAILFFNELEGQVSEHVSTIKEDSYMIQVEIIRNHEKFY